jgi:hypothetical protein
MKPFQLIWVALIGLLILPYHPAGAQFRVEEIDDDPISPYQRFDTWFQVRYNRVEGAYPRIGTYINILSQSKLGLIGEVGYGHNNERWGYEAGIQKEFFQKHPLVVRMAGFRETHSSEKWTIGGFENSLACFFLKEDFLNHYGRRGWKCLLQHRWSDRLNFYMHGGRRRYENMAMNSQFAPTLFGQQKRFRPNPPVEEGAETYVRMGLEFDCRDNPFFPRRGWLFGIALERMWGDFETTGLFVHSDIHIPTVLSHKFVIQSKMGLRAGRIGSQHLLSLGGLSNLRAFPEYFRRGRSLFFVSLNYLFEGHIIRELGLLEYPLMDATSFGLFFDFGDAWYNPDKPTDFLEGMSKFRGHADAGVSLRLFDGLVRIDTSRQLVSGDGDWRVTMRLLDMF